MKIQLLRKISFVVITLILFSCSKENKYVISGNIINSKDKVLHFNKLTLDGVEKLDSITLSSDGEFSFSGERLTEPTFFTLNVDSKTITLLSDSNVHMQIMGEYKTLDENYKVINSSESESIRLLNNKLRSTIADLNVLQQRYQRTENTNERNNILSEITVKIEEQKSYIGSYVMKNPFSFASYYAIYQKFDNETFVLNIDDKRDQVYYAAVASSLKSIHPNNQRVINLYDYVLKVKQRQKVERTNELMKALPAIGYPELNITDLAGKKQALSSLKGKVVLLTFWASWSKDSRLFNAELNNIYKKYGKKGFEIYQVSLDQNKLYWEAAIMQDKLPWINVCELTYPKSFAATIYNISNLPANYLISKQGDIVGRNLSGALLEEKIMKNL